LPYQDVIGSRYPCLSTKVGRRVLHINATHSAEPPASLCFGQPAKRLLIHASAIKTESSQDLSYHPLRLDLKQIPGRGAKASQKEQLNTSHNSSLRDSLGNTRHESDVAVETQRGSHSSQHEALRPKYTKNAYLHQIIASWSRPGYSI
jgi:hypothetical protein